MFMHACTYQNLVAMIIALIFYKLFCRVKLLYYSANGPCMQTTNTQLANLLWPNIVRERLAHDHDYR